MLQAAAAALQMSGSIAPDAQLCAARVALFKGSGSGSGSIVCVDPSHVEEMSSDALVTAAGAAGGTGTPLQLTAVRIEARSGMGDDEVRVVMQAVCDALRGQKVEGSDHSVKATVPPPPPPPSPTPPTPPHGHPSRAATTTTTTLATPPPSSPPPPPTSPRPPATAPLSPPRSAALATEAHTVPPRSGAKIVGPKVTTACAACFPFGNCLRMRMLGEPGCVRYRVTREYQGYQVRAIVKKSGCSDVSVAKDRNEVQLELLLKFKRLMVSVISTMWLA